MTRQTCLDIAQAKSQNKEVKVVTLFPNYPKSLQREKVIVWNLNIDLLTKLRKIREN